MSGCNSELLYIRHSTEDYEENVIVHNFFSVGTNLMQCVFNRMYSKLKIQDPTPTLTYYPQATVQ